MGDPERWIVVLAGGVGSRFWPASRPSRPKQLLPLGGDRPLIVESVERALTLAPPERLGVLASEPLASRLREALPQLPDGAFWVEPEPRGTAPVLAWAAWRVARSNPDAVLVSLHADHAIRPLAGFTSLIGQASRVAAEESVLMTIAIEPDRPETGYGYIRPGEPLGAAVTTGVGAAEGGDGAAAFRVRAFEEKPDARTAARYLEEGFLWNSGIFLWRAGVFLEELRRHAPAIGDLLPLLDEGDAAGFFRRAPRISVDEAVLERSGRVAAMRATFRWDDVGTWESLARTGEPDDEGNVTVGRSHIAEGRRNIVFAEDGAVVLFGVDDLVAVRSGGVTLVTHRSRAPELKRLVDALPPDLEDPGP